jgi:hypothetical protein
MNEYDISFELNLKIDSFDSHSNVFVEAICERASELAHFGDVHAGGEASSGLLAISVQVTSFNLSSATASAYTLLTDSIKISGIQAEIRNQSAIAV